ncbi:hypothetical protein L0E83_08015 [Marichromatium gracile]|uniref:hypothetical protein n=1 Tax=Marichromatium TaxID=85076 RepID=UPI000F4189E2|nr:MULTISPECIES: hypothetical protein [Marichromatium]MBO8084532.1 hypothetical protein [Marichromatium sp.]MCF1183380.1 hypothetical protein [Marichromatium gracile]RNE91627.1 hypothetical protein EBL84_03360 [Marichromatium sp. AB31]RNE93427.1 hypothetical protein EBL85_07170 [Marichromatium sp. AB32]
MQETATDSSAATVVAAGNALGWADILIPLIALGAALYYLYRTLWANRGRCGGCSGKGKGGGCATAAPPRVTPPRIGQGRR